MMDNRENAQPNNIKEENLVKGSLLESMMEPMDQLSKIPPDKTDRRTSDEEMN
ncbi:hypothetical protein [Cytobacillus firmus]|uniref:hypothetical protein n=1 Tax=Cytobacillus firmus TaxID=1399 RepID=UPI0012E7DA30|nr:hypothetical protein [Cytobacillus firmus]MEC1891876.1 hypothetical protein [Cytobacillus firmus]MED1905300.1 hypothetical protein [Cytobacillus firmus]MED1939566.1 hypothetical protein [Cytobacillus firmus]MED4449016.1 hypothetical protein [Cytobacillus firmus]MED4767912.1 hypothetical protein [Cytobacillus firmus]